MRGREREREGDKEEEGETEREREIKRIGEEEWIRGEREERRESGRVEVAIIWVGS